MNNALPDQKINLELTVDDSIVLQSVLSFARGHMDKDHFITERTLIATILDKLSKEQELVIKQTAKCVGSATYAKMFYNENNDTIEVKEIHQ